MEKLLFLYKRDMFVVATLFGPTLGLYLFCPKSAISEAATSFIIFCPFSRPASAGVAYSHLKPFPARSIIVPGKPVRIPPRDRPVACMAKRSTDAIIMRTQGGLSFCMWKISTFVVIFNDCGYFHNRGKFPDFGIQEIRIYTRRQQTQAFRKDGI